MVILDVCKNYYQIILRKFDKLAELCVKRLPAKYSQSIFKQMSFESHRRNHKTD